jgi:hypothetical protein
MHKAQKEWCESLRRKFPIYFYTKRVLDIGSLDVNGTNRYLFYNCHYDGVDIIAGKGVDIVCPAHKLTGERYDVVLSMLYCLQMRWSMICFGSLLCHK